MIDGANVGFYMREYSNKKFSYRQIQAVVRSIYVISCSARACPISNKFIIHLQVNGLEARGETVLVILPQSYTNNGAITLAKFKQRIDNAELEILQE